MSEASQEPTESGQAPGHDADATVLDRLFKAAEDQLWADFERAGVFDHSGVIGTTREYAVATFLAEHLPRRFGVTGGKAVDRDGVLTPQLDLIIFDGYLSAPLLSRATGPELLPAEALIAVVEVKSMLSRDETRTCLQAADAISRLNVYDQSFVTSRIGGESAADGAPRCMYSVLAFDSNLAADDWAEKEWKRLNEVASELKSDVRRIDRLTVLSRGLLVPTTSTGRVTSSGRGALRAWFLHLSDFLVREAARRQPYDWHPYARPESESWLQLEGYKSAAAAARRQRRAARKRRQSRPG